jgi:hypothetical protein
VPMPSRREKEALKRVVRGIVLVQGNVFIKELLRRNAIRIGVTKVEFEKSLLEAIEAGRLQREDVEKWLSEVEGWGDQHVYLYKVPQRVIDDPLWSDLEGLRGKIRRVGLGELWQADTSLEFPPDRKLTSISLHDEALRLTWHQGLYLWVRDKDKDYQERIGPDLYEFLAHRQQADRSVMCFEMHLATRLAAIFIQEKWNKEAHARALAEVRDVATKIFNFGDLIPYSVSKAIKGLDQSLLESAQPSTAVRPHSTRLSGAGAYVEFASTSGQSGYQEFEPIRHVRRAVRPERFRGEQGVFLFRRTGPRGSTRDLRIQLYGAQRRIRLWAQMNSQEVWGILESLKKYG